MERAYRHEVEVAARTERFVHVHVRRDTNARAPATDGTRSPTVSMPLALPLTCALVDVFQITSLENEGHVYPTIDDEHMKAT